MISVVLAMLVIMLLAGVIVLYVAYPHRGEDVPHTPWLGAAMRRGVDSLPTLDNTEDADADMALLGHHEHERL